MHSMNSSRSVSTVVTKTTTDWQYYEQLQVHLYDLHWSNNWLATCTPQTEQLRICLQCLHWNDKLISNTVWTASCPPVLSPLKWQKISNTLWTFHRLVYSVSTEMTNSLKLVCPVSTKPAHDQQHSMNIVLVYEAVGLSVSYSLPSQWNNKWSNAMNTFNLKNSSLHRNDTVSSILQTLCWSFK